MAMAETASVKVFIRLRPYNQREKDIGLEKEKDFIKFSGGSKLDLVAASELAQRRARVRK